MTDREAKWIAIERMRNAMEFDFTPECLLEAATAAVPGRWSKGAKFWFAGVEFVIVGFDLSEQLVKTKPCGGRAITENEAITREFRMART